MATVLVEGATRPGYDPVRQFVSVLSLGDGGWMQTVNSVGSGLLLSGFGIGLGRATGVSRGRWLARLLVLAGLAFAASGLFAPDPQLGYPYWISVEAASNPTLHARLHIAGGFVATSAFSMAMMLDAWHAARAGAPGRAAYALASAAIMLGCFLVGLATEGPGGTATWSGLLQRAGLIAGLLWLVSLAAAQLRIPNRAPPPWVTPAHGAERT